METTKKTSEFEAAKRHAAAARASATESAIQAATYGPGFLKDMRDWLALADDWETAATLLAARDTGGCRCEVCGGRDDDPAGIHGRRR